MGTYNWYLRQFALIIKKKTYFAHSRTFFEFCDLKWNFKLKWPYTVRYQYHTVPYRTVRSQISFALTGLAARANHLFYRFRTVFRVLCVMRPWYESCVRAVSPFDLVFATCVRLTSTRVVIAPCRICPFPLPRSKAQSHFPICLTLLSNPNTLKAIWFALPGKIYPWLGLQLAG